MTIAKRISVSDAIGDQHLISLDAILPRTAIYAVVINDGQFLMVKDTKSGLWEFPGGGVDANESEVAALKRELWEETGLFTDDAQLNPDQPIFSANELFYDLTSRQAWNTQRKFYLISNISGQISSSGNGSDAAEVGFQSIVDLKDFISPTVKKVLVAANLRASLKLP